MPLDELLIKGPRGRRNLKLRLIAANVMANACVKCGIETWQDQPLSMQLHHINGDTHDNRIENLELLCPNCHSQTDTYGAKKLRLLTT